MSSTSSALTFILVSHQYCPPFKGKIGFISCKSIAVYRKPRKKDTLHLFIDIYLYNKKLAAECHHRNQINLITTV